MRRAMAILAALLAAFAVLPVSALGASPADEVRNYVWQTDGEWGTWRDVMPGETIRCRAEATLQGGEAYVLRGTLSQGLDFGGIAVLQSGGVPVNASFYTLVTRRTLGCAFEIHLSDSFAARGEQQIELEYTLRRNDLDDADGEWFSIAVADGRGKTLSGEAARVDSFSLAICRAVTIPDMGKQSNPLSGACFCLYRDRAMQSRVAFREQGGSAYLACRAGECGHTRHAYVLRTEEAGMLVLRGLAAGTYYLQETRPPQGFGVTADALEIMVTGSGEIVANGELLPDGTLRLVEQVGTPSSEKKPDLLDFYEKGCRVMAAALTVLVLARRYLI